MNKGLHFGAVDDRIGAESVLDMAQARRFGDQMSDFIKQVNASTVDPAAAGVGAAAEGAGSPPGVAGRGAGGVAG